MKNGDLDDFDFDAFETIVNEGKLLEYDYNKTTILFTF